MTWSLSISLLSIAIAIISTVIAILSFLRAMAGNLPSVEFVVEEHISGELDYKILVENPGRRSVLLESIHVHRPDPDGVNIVPDNIDSGGVIERTLEEYKSSESGYKAVYLSIPAGESRELSVLFVEETQGLKCCLKWSQHLPMPDRLFMPKKITVSADKLRAMKLAASTRRGEC